VCSSDLAHAISLLSLRLKRHKFEHFRLKELYSSWLVT